MQILRARFYLQTAAETELAERLVQIEAAEALQALVIAAAQAEQLADFIERLDEIAPPADG